MPEAARSGRSPSGTTVAIDIQAAQGGAGCSVGRYSAALTAALLRAGPAGWSVSLVVSPFAPVPTPILDAARRSAAAVRWLPLPLPAPDPTPPDAVVSAAYDSLPLDGAVYLGLGPLQGFGTPGVCAPATAPRWAGRVGVLLHDLTPVMLPEQFFQAFSPYEMWYRDRLRLCADADFVLTPTRYVADQATYGLGRSAPAAQVLGVALPPGTGLRGRPDRAGPAGSIVTVCTGTPEEHPEWLEEAVSARSAPSGERAPARILTSPDLGADALAYVVTSLAAGYDLWAMEAAAAGIPVLAPDIPAWVDLLGTPEAVFDPADPRSLASLLDRVTAEPVWGRDLAARQARAMDPPTWQEVAGRVVRAVDPGPAAAQPGPGPGRPRRGGPRPPVEVALTGPLPPVPSGISKYIEDQTRAATGRIRVGWVAAPGDRRPRPSEPGPAVMEPGEVPGTGLWWHHLANHRLFHTRQFQYLAEHGGVAELHDIALPFVIPPILVPPPGLTVPADLQAELHAIYAGRSASHSDAEEAGVVALLRWLARHADAFVVHSGQAREMLAEYCAGSCPPTYLVPHGSWMSVESRTLALARRLRLPDRPYVVAPGFVGPAKWPEGVVSAVGMVPEPVRPLLVFAGRCPVHLEAKLESLARRAGVDLHITGFLSSDDFDSWLAGAAAAVIGRLVTRGETSGTVIRSSRMGTPTVVAASGAISELPGDVPLLSTVEVVPSRLAGRLADILASPQADPFGPARREAFVQSLERLRSAFSWEPTVELMAELVPLAGARG